MRRIACPLPPNPPTRWRPALALTALALALAGSACSSIFGIEEAELTDDEKDPKTGAGGNRADTVRVRFGHFHGAGGDLALCSRLSSAGGEYAPVLPEATLRYPSVSAYATLPAGTYDFAYVRKGDDCNVAATRPTENAIFNGFEAPAGARMTVALLGDGALVGPNAVTRFLPLRDAGPPEDGRGVRLRFVHVYQNITDYSLGFDEGLFRGEPQPSEAYLDVFAGANFEIGVAPASDRVDGLGYSTVPLPGLGREFIFWQKWYDDDLGRTDPEDTGAQWQLPPGAGLLEGTVATIFYAGREIDGAFSSDEVTMLLCRDEREVAGLTECVPLE
jgi:hypothetical protein